MFHLNLLSLNLKIYQAAVGLPCWAIFRSLVRHTTHTITHSMGTCKNRRGRGRGRGKRQRNDWYAFLWGRWYWPWKVSSSFLKLFDMVVSVRYKTSISLHVASYNTITPTIDSTFFVFFFPNRKGRRPMRPTVAFYLDVTIITHIDGSKTVQKRLSP